ncbi:MAG: PD-(D/E)XK nuclease family protein [Synergistaceae bacterium]|nr:PD-(D/E)XK nuclease family protein [Synergistaceae bacterium]
MQNENAKIIILGVGKGVADVLRELTRSNINGADFAFTSMNNSVVDYYVDVPVKFHVSDLNDCERIVKEKFSDTDIMFVIVNANESDEPSLAVRIAKNAKSNGIFTIGIAAHSGGINEFSGRINEFSNFVNSFESPFDAVFFLHPYRSSQKKTYLKIIECISDPITKSGYVNIDFDDVKAIIQDSDHYAYNSAGLRELCIRLRSFCRLRFKSCRCHERLLSEAVKISDRYNEIYRITKDAEKHRFICRVLRELLSPSGIHNQGSLFLRPFIRKVLRLNDIPDSELDDAEVSCEYSTRQNRRIDLAIKTANYFIAIRVKVYAKNSDDQCRDYYEEAKRHCADENHAKIVYLTTYGIKPDPESASGNEICISFVKDIHDWHEECLSCSENEFLAVVHENAIQLLKRKDRFTNQMKEDKKMELAELITKSPDNFRAAIELRDALPSAVEAMRKKFLESVCGLLKTFGYERECYAPGKRDCAITYRYDKLPDTVVCLGSSQSDTYISYLFTVRDKAKFVNFLAGLQEFRGDECNDKFGGNFFGWEYCRLNNSRISPNFYPDNPNEAMFELCDNKKFNEFVIRCAEKIEEFLKYSPENHDSCQKI